MQTFKNFGLKVTDLYRKKNNQQTFDDFILPFGDALVIMETLGLTDEETVEQIRENLYLQ